MCGELQSFTVPPSQRAKHLARSLGTSRHLTLRCSSSSRDSNLYPPCVESCRVPAGGCWGRQGRAHLSPSWALPVGTAGSEDCWRQLLGAAERRISTFLCFPQHFSFNTYVKQIQRQVSDQGSEPISPSLQLGTPLSSLAVLFVWKCP